MYGNGFSVRVSDAKALRLIFREADVTRMNGEAAGNGS